MQNGLVDNTTAYLSAFRTRKELQGSRARKE